MQDQRTREQRTTLPDVLVDGQEREKKMSPRIIFEQELEELKSKVVEMGERAEISYDKLVFAIRGNDRDSMNQLLDNDRQMVDMQRSIEAKCLFLLTKQQPVARDMRMVSAALKVVTDIERIGDHVSDIAELYLRMDEKGMTDSYAKKLETMMEEAKGMLHASVEAFVNGDEKSAEKVIDHDDVVDDLFNQIKEDMMEAIRTQTLDADKVVDYLMIAKYLEKIGDHAVNIGEWAIFQVTGDIQGTKLY